MGGGGAAGPWQHAGAGGHFLTEEEMQHLPAEAAQAVGPTGGAGDGGEATETTTGQAAAGAAAGAGPGVGLGDADASGGGGGGGGEGGGFRRGRTYNLSFEDAPLVRFTPHAASTEHELSGAVSGLLTFNRDGPWRCAQVRSIPTRSAQHVTLCLAECVFQRVPEHVAVDLALAGAECVFQREVDSPSQAALIPAHLHPANESPHESHERRSPMSGRAPCRWLRSQTHFFL